MDNVGNKPALRDIYGELGVKTYINAWDTMSVIGGSRMEDATVDAMKDAASAFVEIRDLQARIGADIARMTRNEAAYIVDGASAGLLLSAASCMALTAQDKPLTDALRQLPCTDGLKDEIIVMAGHRNSYDFAIKAAGARTVQVGDPECCTEQQLIDGITDRTCAIFFFDTHMFTARGLPLERVVNIAHARGLRVVVDGAAQLPPKENLWYYTRGCGADIALFSGGKGLRGPQQSGLAVGTAEMIGALSLVAAPNQGIGRSSKTGREEMVALYTALKAFLAEGAVQRRQDYIADATARIMRELDASGLFKCERIWPGPTGQSYDWVRATIVSEGVTGQALATALKDGEPGVRVGASHRGPEGITVNPLNLAPNEIDIVIRRVIEAAGVLAKAK